MKLIKVLKLKKKVIIVPIVRTPLGLEKKCRNCAFWIETILQDKGNCWVDECIVVERKSDNTCKHWEFYM